MLSAEMGIRETPSVFHSMETSPCFHTKMTRVPSLTFSWTERLLSVIRWHPQILLQKNVSCFCYWQIHNRSRIIYLDRDIYRLFKSQENTTEERGPRQAITAAPFHTQGWKLYLFRRQLERLYRLRSQKQLQLFHNEHFPITIESLMQISITYSKWNVFLKRSLLKHSITF